MRCVPSHRKKKHCDLRHLPSLYSNHDNFAIHQPNDVTLKGHSEAINGARTRVCSQAHLMRAPYGLCHLQKQKFQTRLSPIACILFGAARHGLLASCHEMRVCCMFFPFSYANCSPALNGARKGFLIDGQRRDRVSKGNFRYTKQIGNALHIAYTEPLRGSESSHTSILGNLHPAHMLLLLLLAHSSILCGGGAKTR